ncbi:multiprotein-bridging factor 1 family protein [Amycolatopsis japonica]|uniref:helix-turn-helix domain-containing protein n=1 Tax=Amycolatopsis japonica TaxID=208439 RepID=UPI00366E9547
MTNEKTTPGGDGATLARTRDDARVQGNRPPFDRSGPLPREVAEHLRDGVGARLREARGARGWTQAECAAQSGVTAKTLGRLERGEHRPTHAQLGKLGRALTPGEGPVARVRAAHLIRDLAVLASPHVRGRVRRGVPRPAVSAEVVAAEADAMIRRVGARMPSVQPSTRTPVDQARKDA